MRADCLENVGASTSHEPVGLHGLLQGLLYLLRTFLRKQKSTSSEVVIKLRCNNECMAANIFKLFLYSEG
jgi:hypothetical protein